MNRRNRKKKESSLFDDFKSWFGKFEFEKMKAFWSRLPKLHQRALSVLVPLVLVLIVLPAPVTTEESGATGEDKSEPVRTEVSVNTTGLSEEGETSQAVTKTDAWQEYTVQSGDTLAKVFRSNKLPMADLNALVAIEGLDKPLSKIKQGQLVRFKLTSEGTLDILQLEKSGASVMFFRLSDGGFGRSK